MRHFPRLLLALLLLMGMGAPAWSATPLPKPTGRVILTVSGNITRTNVGDEARFDAAMLNDLGRHTVATHTPWTDGVSHFAGPLGRDLLDRVGAKGEVLRVKALNDYVSELPACDFYDYDVLLALERDGKPMSVRSFGPLFVLYPFDAKPELQTEKIRFRSVWQVVSIEVE
ncbi:MULTISPECIES: oxidoreductase [unclassified Modicisalibacter]|uniref:oxidoreductase n=1 Tax=unclassified Modicisalibacter TaxID=2679913 RepID=UPI001CCAEF68|nr:MULTISPECIES: oxidoreductase [unclassified Modicisalibacter]MBZ9559850.1 oxidoreductase [Modicisalibacter sp. R2A 31.J]MBZ9577302.1 oxidoreductase [Modicisalibacter sp. MOD 31.J]